MLFHDLHSPDPGVYLNRYAFSLRGKVDPLVLEQAWRHVLDRREVLRTVFAWEGLERPVQAVLDRALLPWQVLDWRGAPPVEQEERLRRFLEAEGLRRFDLLRAPLLRLALVRTADEAEAARKAGLVPDDLEFARFERLWGVFRANVAAAAAYRPGPAASDVLLVLAEDRAEPAAPEAARWAARTSGSVRSVTVPGDHFTLVREPQVREVADLLVHALGDAAPQRAAEGGGRRGERGEAVSGPPPPAPAQAVGGAS